MSRVTAGAALRHACAAAMFVLLAPVAQADEPRCEAGSFHEPIDVDVRPSHGATGVALNAPVVVRHLQEADLDTLERGLATGEALVSLLREGRNSDAPREVVPGHTERLDARTVAFVPARALARETTYHPLIAKPGFDVTAFAELRFETGREADSEPPDLPVGKGGIRIASEPVPAACDGPPGRWRVAVTIPPASDDGDAGAIEYFLYLTRGLDVEGPELRDRARSDGGDVRMDLILTSSQSREVTCVAVRAVDGLGRPAEAETETCFDPIDGSYFRACAVRTPGADRRGAGFGTGMAGCVVAFLVVLVLRCRVRSRAEAARRPWRAL